MLAVAGGKGGCGKTTTTLGLATALDGPTTVVDADTDMPNLHSLAGVPREPPQNHVGHVHPRDDTVTVYPAPTNSAGAHEERGDRTDDGKSRLRRVRDTADGQVLIDCPAGAGPDAATPLREADEVLLVTPPCTPALRDTVKTAAMADALGTNVLGAVLVRARVVPSGVESLLGCPVLGTVPPVDPPVLDAESVRRAYRKVATVLHADKEL
ncbi:CDP-4-keto-6-deoxy-D-glucose-3-dehydrase [Halogeometricum borinquense]|uniref:nucleotide-binding protein n=1 Tax=Halogeometricum borinquense TaxID=60847 RepID=UPI0034329BBE